MATPIQSNQNQEGCTPISSNCIIWQGPDIECIDLCKGDSISDVTAKLATELCTVLEQLDITTLDLTCFNPICPSLENFQELIQFLIDRICTCCTPSDDTGVSAGCPEDCIIDIAPCFYYQNPQGDTITQMTIADYAKAMGTKICDLVSQISSINLSISSLQSQLSTLNTKIIDTDSKIPAAIPNLFTSCLISPVPVEGIPVDQLLTTLETAFCQLRAVTGLPPALLSSILQQCVNLDTTETLNLPGVNMGSLPNWKLQSSYSTLADSVNNLWITVCDIRAAVRSILDTCCPQGCEGLIISLQTTYTTPNINFFWTGDGTGFEDCNPAGSLITITDAYGATFTTRIPIVAYINLPYALNISGSPLNTGTNLTIHIDACFRKISDGTTCERCIETSIINQSACPALTLSADDESIVYSFSNVQAGAVQYDIILNKFSDGSLIDQHTVILAAPGPVSGTFTGLLPGTMYTITVEITINGVVTNTCPLGLITTEPLECDPPIAVSAEAIP